MVALEAMVMGMVPTSSDTYLYLPSRFAKYKSARERKLVKQFTSRKDRPNSHHQHNKLVELQ